MKRYLLLTLLGFLFFSGFAQDDFKYQTPPKDIQDLALSKPTPSVSIDDKAEWMLLMERSDFPTIEELSQPELRIAGLRINPNNYGPSRAGSSTNIQIKNIKENKLYEIEGLPSDPRISAVQWSPDQKKFAFVNTTNTTIDLYVVDIQSKAARKINTQPLNTVIGGSFQWAGNDMLVYKTIVPGKQLTAIAGAPTGPVVQESLGRSAASRTYQDLIKNAYDEALFEHYATSQVVKNDLSKETVIGQPDIYRSVNVSPNNKYVLITTIDKPFSYLVPAGGFPHTVSVIDINGQPVKQLAKNPSSEGQPIGFDDVVTFPRSFNWRDDEPSTVTYVQALDKGLGRQKAEYRDGLYAINLEGITQPKELFKTKMRFAGVMWGTKDVAVFYERFNATRKIKMNRYNPATGAVDSLFERSSNDAYSDIGSPMTARNQYGQNTLIVLNGKELLLRSQGASSEGDMPFVQTFDISTGKKNMLWRSKAPYYETVVDVIDPKNGVFLTSRESPTETANYYIRNTKKKIAP
ncbi:MAG TPA: hypothetical protein VGD33_12455, partial [Chitinophagaceae bacterium]